MIASMTKVLSILMIIMSTTEGYKAVQTKDAAHGEGALSLGGTDHKVAYAVDASGALTAMDSIEAEAGEAGEAAEAAEEEEAAEAKAADEMLFDEFYDSLGLNYDSSYASFQKINGTKPAQGSADWSKGANWLPSFKAPGGSSKNPIPTLGAGVNDDNEDEKKTAYATEFQAAKMTGLCAADKVKDQLSVVVFLLWRKVVSGFVEIAKAIKTGKVKGVEHDSAYKLVLPTDATGNSQIYPVNASFTHPSNNIQDEKGLAFALLCRVVVPFCEQPWCAPFGATLGWLGPKKSGVPPPGKLRQQIEASFSEAKGKASVAWLARFRKLFDVGDSGKKVGDYMPNDREIITTLYKFPSNPDFKKLLYNNYKSLRGLNKAFLKDQYCANGLDGCTDGAKSDGRLLQLGQKDHFFFHAQSWSAFNLPSGRWFQMPEGDPPTEQRSPSTAVPLQHKVNSNSTDKDTFPGGLSNAEKEAWKEEGQQGSTLKMNGGGMAFTAPKTRKTPKGDTQPDAPAAEAIVEAKWLRIGGCSGTTSDLMALWYAFTPEAGKPGRNTTAEFLMGKGYTAQAMRSALMRFYLQAQVHSAMEVFLGAEPFLDGTDLSMVAESTKTALGQVKYNNPLLFKDKLEKALCPNSREVEGQKKAAKKAAKKEAKAKKAAKAKSK